MKLHFEDNLDYQLRAIDSVVKLFKGQESGESEFTVTMPRPKANDKGVYQATLAEGAGTSETDLGIGNHLKLLDDEILENLNEIQLRNGLAPSPSLTSGNFTVEMETGTGKTYVYLRTIFELHKEYGFTKFVIVVPSIAIKEGVYKNLEITRDHFENLYPGCKGYVYFLYDSGDMGSVRDFATSSQIRIMVTTVGSINKKDVNNLYKNNEKTDDYKPIDLIKATRPVLIVDEPQSVDGGIKGKGKEALEAMNPLCTLRYSATHVEKYHMVYRLDAVDAYEKELVKQIEVASLQIEGANNKPYIKLLSTHNIRGSISAKIETAGNEIITVQDGDDLEQETGRAIYENMQVGTIYVANGQDAIEIRGPGLDVTLRQGEELNGVNPDDIKRLMIKRTIKEHLDKEKYFAANNQPIKVLSLFFIDHVANYRLYDDDGNKVKGKYAEMFEEEYVRLARTPDYQELFHQVDLTEEVEKLHDGYFSIDKKGKLVDTEENNQTNQDNAERAYSLIMRDKEKLLSFDTKLKFIFSHSALKEGWDNPNVFQICSLRDMSTERERRQTIGRGLRLCVNQNGERLRGFDINTLTVIATESYEDFAENLQKEIENDTGIRFGIVEKHQFATIMEQTADGVLKALGVQKSEQLWEFLKDNGYINAKGKIQDSLRQALKTQVLELPDEFTNQQIQIEEILAKLAGKLDIKNADKKTIIKAREAVLHGEEFQALWNRIKYKTVYRVDFDDAKLIENCAEAITNAPPITKTRARFRKADIAIGEGGVTVKSTSDSNYTTIQEEDIELPDILTDLQDKTQFTRRSIVDILIQSRRLRDFQRNPQDFMELCAEAINRTKRLALVDGIKYQKLGKDYYYAQELFEEKELQGYLNNSIATKKSVYERVVYDSQGVERSFAESLDRNEAVKVYAKLPLWFKIQTPLGSYNPDWAVLIEENGCERLFFVVETKSSVWFDDLRHHEGGKIACAKEHFKEIASINNNPAKYIPARNVGDVLKHTK